MLTIRHKMTGLLLFGIGMGLFCTQENPVTPQSTQSDTVVHNADITRSETWASDKVHRISSPVTVKNATLRIDPGAAIVFDPGVSLSILDSAGLVADGSQKSISFSSAAKKKGDWGCIYFAENSLDDSCALVNCTIEYGGGDTALSAMIYCDGAAPAISGCTLRNSASNGVVLNGDCRPIEFHSNTIADNDAAPVASFAVNVSFIGSNQYSNNAIAALQITDGTITENSIWYPHDLPFLFTAELDISSAQLILNSGIELKFDGDVGVTISEGGSLHADGVFAPIIFTGEYVGGWNGIFLTRTANSGACTFNNCLIECGGRNSRYPANVVLEYSSPTIANCIVQKSLGYGIFIDGDFMPVLFSNNQVTENRRAPFSISANDVANVPYGDYAGNGEDVIEVRGTPSAQPMTRDGYWQYLGMPYKIIDTIQILSCTLTLAPGTTLLMTERSGFEILAQGGLIAEGVSSNIAIQAIRPVVGLWAAIYFSPLANAQSCRLVHCDISYGGGDSSLPGMIVCDHISPTIQYCRIEYSQTWGIYMRGNETITDLQSNMFNNNGFGDSYVAPN